MGKHFLGKYVDLVTVDVSLICIGLYLYYLSFMKHVANMLRANINHSVYLLLMSLTYSLCRVSDFELSLANVIPRATFIPPEQLSHITFMLRNFSPF